MLALIMKELRCYAHQRTYRRVQFFIVCLLAIILFAAAFELFAQSQTGSQVNVGSGIYSIFVIALFIAMLCFAVPLQAVEAMQIETESTNLNLLYITPISGWKLLGGKLIGAIISGLWSVSLALPLFWLSIYTGGLAHRQLFACGLVLIASVTLFSMIGISFALFGTRVHVKSRSYIAVLSISFLPLILSHTISLDGLALDLLRLLSPLCVLLSVIQLETDFLWLCMVCFYSFLSAFIFLLSWKRLTERMSVV